MKHLVDSDVLIEVLRNEEQTTRLFAEMKCLVIDDATGQKAGEYLEFSQKSRLAISRRVDRGNRVLSASRFDYAQSPSLFDDGH